MDRWTGTAGGAAWAAVVLACVAVGGCSGNNKGLIAQSAAYVLDVPVPMGYKLKDRQSLDVMAGKSRVVQHVYRGSGRSLDVRNFYEEQMPMAGWHRRVVQNNNGTYTLQFEKGGEYCSIHVTPSRAGFLGGTIIHLTILPHATSDDTAAVVGYSGIENQPSASDSQSAGVPGRP